MWIIGLDPQIAKEPHMHKPLILLVAMALTLLPNSRNALAQSSKPVARNVLLIVADDLRASVLGCYGDKFCQTPNIDRLAQSGMLFRHAYCQGTVCAPSRKSFMYSRYRDTKGVNLGEHLQTHGLYTARVGKIYHMRVPGDIIAGTNGLDVATTWTERFNAPGREAHTPGDYACLNQNIFTRSQKNRESTRMPNRPFVSVVCDTDGSDQPDFRAATKAMELLQTHKDEQFLLAVGLVRPHYPMVAPEEYFASYPWQQMELPPSQEGDLDDIPKPGKSGTSNVSNPIGRYPTNQKRMWTAYYAAVSFMDAQVGRILDELDRLGLRDSTAIVFISDHGYHLGDHGFWQKSNLHEQVLRVPMIWSVPGMPSGQTDALSELVDIYPTVCDLVGVPISELVQGKSLLPVVRSPDARVRDAALSLNKGYSLRTDHWHYMAYQQGGEELYDMTSDPNQFTNLVSSEQHAGRLKTMRNSLQAKLTEHDLPTLTQKTSKQPKPTSPE